MTKCCRYAGTEDCAPCELPPWKWKCNLKLKESPKRDPQKRWKSAMIKKWMGPDRGRSRPAARAHARSAPRDGRHAR